MTLPKLSVIAVLAATFIFLMFVAVNPVGAAVYPQSSFHYEGFGGVYDGTCTTLFSDGHFINTCHATLTSGTPVSVTTALSGPSLHGVITPSGHVTEVIVSQQ